MMAPDLRKGTDVLETGELGDTMTASADRGREDGDSLGMLGMILVECFGPDGELKWRSEQPNLITAVGDQMYASRGAGLTTSATPTGMKLGTGTTAVAKTGAGAALVTYLPGSNKAFDATFPSASGGVVTYKRTYAAGEATSVTAISEVVIVTDTIATDATSTAANTISRGLLANPAGKAAGDSLAITWSHTLTGQ
jgi:hypothetical protein